jgi:BMFP domain-containing protein YqiC
MTKTSAALDAFTQLAAKLDEVIQGSPVSDLERNARQHLISRLAKQGLVTREEFEVQLVLLERAGNRVRELEARVAALEATKSKP